MTRRKATLCGISLGIVGATVLFLFATTTVEKQETAISIGIYRGHRADGSEVLVDVWDAYRRDYRTTTKVFGCTIYCLIPREETQYICTREQYEAIGWEFIEDGNNNYPVRVFNGEHKSWQW